MNLVHEGVNELEIEVMPWNAALIRNPSLAVWT